MRKKIIAILSACTLGVASFALAGLLPRAMQSDENPQYSLQNGLGNGEAKPLHQGSSEDKTIYVASSGNDTSDGSYSAPFATLNQALEKVENGGTISLKDTVVLDAWQSHGKSVYITGGGLNASGLTEVEINDSVTFSNLAWVVDAGAFVFANGYETVIGEGVTWSNEIRIFGGGKQGTTVADTSLTLLSGTYSHIYGGSYQGTVEGDTHLVVGGTVNNTSSVDKAIQDHTENYFVFGGGHTTNKVKGSANLLFTGNAKAVYAYGGTHGLDGTISQGTNLTVDGGTLMSVYGGSKGGDVGGNANTWIKGGKIEQVFGGNQSWPFRTGSVHLRVLGGTVSRRVYAGCYNDTEGLLSLSFKTNYHVENGNICLTLGGGANISYSSSSLDRGVYARSRYNQDVETSALVFADQTAYENYTSGKLKLTAQDSTMKSLMGNLTVADTLHFYQYTQKENVITQTCACHPEHSAATTVETAESSAYVYTGEEIKPVQLSVSDNWEYDLPTVSYANNIEIGKANYSITIGQVCVESDFVVVQTPEIVETSIRISSPSGLRFQSKISKELMGTGATFGSLFIPKEELGANELTMQIENATHVAQTKWATESVFNKDEGCAYFNSVLTDIPSKHYDKVIVMRSYVFANGQYYYSDAVEYSPAQVAAQALQAGETDAILYQFVDQALEDSELAITASVTLFDGQSCKLELLGNKGCVAIWSTDSDLFTVDQEGNIVAGNKEGTGEVQVKIGSRILICKVTVSYIWTDYV